MKILFVGDPHLKINNFDLAKRFLQWLNALIEQQKPDLVVNLGDTFDTHAVVRSEVMSEFMSHVDKVLALNIPYVYLLGNHDMYKPNDSKYHALLSFKGKINNFYIVDQTQELFGMTFVPYKHNPENFPRQTLSVCIAHQTMLGADYGAIRATDGVDPSSISGCEVLISGHIHTRQRIPAPASGPDVLYVGSPFSQSAADIDQVKGITLFDLATYKETFFETPLPAWRRLHAVVSQSTTIETIHALVEQDISKSIHHWVLELEGPKAEIIGYLSSEQYRAAIVGVDVKVKPTFTDKEKKQHSIEAKSMEHIVSEYAYKVYNGSLDRKLLEETAQAVLKQARLS